MTNLTPEQQAAVDSRAPVTVVIAGPGTGKTRTLVARLVALLEEGVPPGRILAVTFTNDAAHEMGVRLRAAHRGDLPEIGTLHAWAANMLRSHGREVGVPEDFLIVDEADHEALVRQVGRDLGVHLKTVRGLLKRDNVRKEVERRMADSGMLTFDAIEAKAIELLEARGPGYKHWRSAYDHVLVDEFQDTSLAQHFLVTELAPQCVFAVGDVRQAIYGWRGATPDILRSVQKQPDAVTLHLSQSFRFGPEIARVANDLMPEHDQIVGRGLPGRVAVHDECSDHELVATLELVLASGRSPNDVAVLARTWWTLNHLADRLKGIVPVRSYSRATDAWLADDARLAVRLLRLLTAPHLDHLATIAFHHESWFPDCRAIAARKRAPLWSTIAEQRGWAWAPLDPDDAPAAPLRQVFRSVTGKPLPDDLNRRIAPWHTASGFLRWHAERGMNRREREDGTPAVTLTTVHGAKGLEWPVVVLPDVCYETYGSSRYGEAAESKRVLYVAATRAQHELHVVRPALIRQRWGSKPTRPFGWLIQ